MKYTTKSGDSFDSVAFKFFQDSRYCVDLMNVNRDKIETFIFAAGTVLEIPEVDRTAKIKTPPWKR